MRGGKSRLHVGRGAKPPRSISCAVSRSQMMPRHAKCPNCLLAAHLPTSDSRPHVLIRRVNGLSRRTGKLAGRLQQQRLYARFGLHLWSKSTWSHPASAPPSGRLAGAQTPTPRFTDCNMAPWSVSNWLARPQCLDLQQRLRRDSAGLAFFSASREAWTRRRAASNLSGDLAHLHAVSPEPPKLSPATRAPRFMCPTAHASVGGRAGGKFLPHRLHPTFFFPAASGPRPALASARPRGVPRKLWCQMPRRWRGIPARAA